MSESDIDREIAAALNVDPSPEFLARVRTRIAEESSQPRWRMNWWWLGAVAAVPAVALVAIMVLQTYDVTPIEHQTADAAVAPFLPSETLPFEAMLPGDPRSAIASVAVQTQSAFVTRPHRKEPEVLVSQAEIAAFKRFVTSLDPRRVDLATLQPDQPPASEPLPALAPLTIEPVIVEPLAPIAH